MSNKIKYDNAQIERKRDLVNRLNKDFEPDVIIYNPKVKGNEEYYDKLEYTKIREAIKNKIESKELSELLELKYEVENSIDIIDNLSFKIKDNIIPIVWSGGFLSIIYNPDNHIKLLSITLVLSAIILITDRFLIKTALIKKFYSFLGREGSIPYLKLKLACIEEVIESKEVLENEQEKA